MKRILLSAVLLTTLVACGDDDKDDKKTIACNWDAEDYCMVVTATQAALNAGGFTSAGCTADGGVAGSSCPATDRLGRCSWGEAGVQVVEHFYSPTYDEANIAGACAEVGGTFTPNFGAGQGAPEGE